MATPTYDLIATHTATTTPTTITISNIDSSYRDLVIVYSGQVTQYDGWLGLQFNGVTSQQYLTMQINESGVSKQNQAEIRWGQHLYTSPSNGLINIFDANQTNKDKSFNYVSGGNGTLQGPGHGAGRWDNTAAITSVTLKGQGGLNFQNGFTLSIYGIVG